MQTSTRSGSAPGEGSASFGLGLDTGEWVKVQVKVQVKVHAEVKAEVESTVVEDAVKARQGKAGPAACLRPAVVS